MTLPSHLVDARDRHGVRVTAPGDPDYPQTRREAIWNGGIDRQPAAIAQPTSTEQVAHLVRVARDAGLDFTVRGGGHGFAGAAVASDALMIDLSRLGHAQVDPATARVRVGGGATLASLDAATAERRLGVVGGTISHTGVAGLTLGGGFGWLTPQQGISADNLVGATLVTAQGRVVHASDETEPELMWGLRGGGGNFGVVTELEYAAQPLEPMANLGLLFWEADQAEAVLLAAQEYVMSLPREYGALVAGLSAPPEPFVPERYQLRPGFAVIVVNWGDPEAHAARLAPVRALRPAFELVTPIPYTALQQMLDAGTPWGAHAYEKALYVDAITPGVVGVALEHLPRKASPLSLTPIFPLRGAYCDVPDDATAFAGSRRQQWVFNIAAVVPGGEGFQEERAWVRTFWDALRPHSADDSTYINFLADADDARVRTSYGEKYARLAALKAVWDPENVFHHNANVRPADGAGPVTPQPRHPSSDIARDTARTSAAGA